MSQRPSDARFPSTCWSRVVAAADPGHPEARAALAELCAAYWFPVYALVRRKGHDPDAALDLTQDYFARLLEKPVLAAADRRKGRFRAFLLTDCVHFLANAHDRAGALKRGGGRTFVPIDAGAAEGRYGAEPAHDLTPERLFERTWALTLLAAVFEALRREYESEGKLNRVRGAQGRAGRGPGLRPLCRDRRSAGHHRGGRQGGRPPAAEAVQGLTPRADRRDGGRPGRGRRRDPRLFDALG